MSNKIIENIRSKFKSEESWQRFLKIAAISLVSIVVIVFFFEVLKTAPHKKKTVNVANIINEKHFLKEHWIISAQKQLSVIKHKMINIKKHNSLLTKEVHDIAVISSNKSKGSLKIGNRRSSVKQFNPNIPGLTNFNRSTPPVPERQANAKPVRITITPIADPINVILNSTPEKHKKKPKKKAYIKGFYVPAGSFTQGLLLNGMDAPSSMEGKSNPYPALIRLTNLSFLPNKYRLSMKGCFVIAEGYGSLSSERVYLRTVSLSCVSKNGSEHISAPIHGYIVGYHGKVGLRGKVVTKQGAILVREMFAGILQGVGQVVRESSMTSSTSPFGETQFLNPSKMGKTAIGSGLGVAAQDLSKFYMKMANSMVPVVIINAGRRLTLVLTRGFYAHFKKNIQLSK